MSETAGIVSWADQIDEDEYGLEPIPPPAQEVTKDGDRIVTEIRVDPDTGKKVKVIRTYRKEKKFGK